jgi:hypothetical protein
MMWKAISLLIACFWALMTALLIRNTYFPDHSGLTEVPLQLVLERFVNQTSSNGLLHLYQDQTRIGHMNIYTTKGRSKLQEGALYRFIISGSVDDMEQKTKPQMALSWRVELELRDAEFPEKLRAEVLLPATEHGITVNWDEGDKLPAIEVKESGKVIMNTESITKLAALTPAMGLLKSMMESRGQSADKAASSLQITSVEGRIELAGRVRTCHVVTFKALEKLRVQMVFTEAGELAMVDLPEGFRLLDPFIYGLEPALIEN